MSDVGHQDLVEGAAPARPGPHLPGRSGRSAGTVSRQLISWPAGDAESLNCQVGQ